jgi:hypothetical protein
MKGRESPAALLEQPRHECSTCGGVGQVASCHRWNPQRGCTEADRHQHWFCLDCRAEWIEILPDLDPPRRL